MLDVLYQNLEVNGNDTNKMKNEKNTKPIC